MLAYAALFKLKLSQKYLNMKVKKCQSWCPRSNKQKAQSLYSICCAICD